MEHGRTTFQQDKWLWKLPVEVADHIRSLLDTGDYALVSNGAGSFVLVLAWSEDDPR